MADDREEFELTALANDAEGEEAELYDQCSACGHLYGELRESYLCDRCVSRDDEGRFSFSDEHIAAEDE